LPGETTIPELPVDSRPYIQQSYEECVDDIIEYNSYIASMQDRYGPTYKVKFYPHFQSIYYRVELAFMKEREDNKGNNDLNRLLNDIESWIGSIQKNASPIIADMEQGHSYFFKLRPYLMLKQMVRISEGVKVEP